MTVCVSNAELKGVLRIALRPLVERVPVVGAVQVSFL